MANSGIPSSKTPDSSRFDSLQHGPGKKEGAEQGRRFAKKHEGQERWEARDPQSGELILLHRLNVEAGASAEARTAMLKAAQAAQQFRHAAVLPVREVRLEADALVFVQNHPPGLPLVEVLARSGPVPVHDALRWMRRFAEALMAAQASGLTLSQISSSEFVVSKPEGGLICLCPPVPNGWWLDVEDPVFASPEQKAGQACDVRSALYSTGAVLAFILTGGMPIRGETWQGFLSLCRLAKPVQEALKSVLRPEPRGRCATPAEWMALLDKALAATAPPPPPPQIKVPVPRQTKQPGSPFWRWAAALIIVGMVAGLLLEPETKRRRAESTAVKSVVREKPPPAPAPPAAKAPPADLPKPALENKIVASQPLVSTLPAQPVPTRPPPPDLKPKPPEEEELIAQAKQAPAAGRVQLYREILARFPQSPRVLHILVAETLQEPLHDRSKREELARWAHQLSDDDDPLGSHALGWLALGEAEDSADLTNATRLLLDAVALFKQSLREGYPGAYFFLLQAYINLHNVQRQDEDSVQAELTRRSLFEWIDNMPDTVPASDPRALAEQLEGLIKERADRGKPHPQAAFLRTVVERLHAMAAKRGDTKSQTWVQHHG